MKYILFSMLMISIILPAKHANSSESVDPEITIKKSRGYEAMIPAEIVRKVKLPKKGYHEGLLLDGDNIWLNNGEGINTWVINIPSEKKTGEIAPVGTFTEGITASPDKKYWVTDWNTEKLYLVRVEENKMVKESEISLAPSHPTGVIWTGQDLYVITWTRGMGTKYHLLKMDSNGNILKKVRMKTVQEPSQLAWDGATLWVTSWFQRRAYGINPETMELTGYFRTSIKNTTGIVWDGEHFWVTGTTADLYQIKINPRSKPAL